MTGPADSTALYVYGLVAASRPPSAEAAPPGLPGTGPVRILPLAEGLHLVAAAAPLPAYSGAEIETRLADLAWVSDRALAHERVVEHFLAQGTVIPLKLFTLFASEAAARKRLGARQEALEAAVRRLEGRLEWGVRVHFDAQEARRRGSGAAAQAAAADSGRRYLQAKRQSREAVRDAAREARRGAQRLYRQLAALAAASHLRETGEEAPAMLLDAAFLLEEARRGELEAVLAAAAPGLHVSGCEITLSGPWPAYHFVEELA